MFVGIDLGTTNSAIAAIVDGEIVVFKTGDNKEVLPSVIYIDHNDRRLFGHRALSQAQTSPTNVASGFKRHIGEGFEIEFEASNQVLNAEQCSTEILNQLLGLARAQLDSSAEITHAVIGVPAAFNQMQNEATKRAALAAGLREVKLLQEPIAAALASEEVSGSASDAFIVFDLGGGTLDVALVQNLSGSLTVEHHEGVNRLGGRDFDRLIVDEVLVPWLLETFDLPSEFMQLDEYTRLRRVLQPAAEDAKIALTSQEKSGIFVPEDNIRTADRAQTQVFVDVDLTKERFEALIGPLLDRTVDVCRDLLKNALYEPEDVDRLVFIGGPTRMPFVRDYVSSALGIPAVKGVDPMTAVAIGSALFGDTSEVSDSSSEASAEQNQDHANIEFLVQEITGGKTARFRLRIKEADPEVAYRLVLSNASDWNFSETAEDGHVVDLPLRTRGDNFFKAELFRNDAKEPMKSHSFNVVRRANVAFGGIAASQTISVMVRDVVNAVGSSLLPILRKGTSLPAAGVHSFQAAVTVEGGSDDELHVQVFQDDGVSDPKLNLFLGYVTVSGRNIPSGERINEGDTVQVNWRMDESSILHTSVTIPSIGQEFNLYNVYVPGAGSLNTADAIDRAQEAVAEAFRDAEKLQRIAINLAPKEMESLLKLVTECNYRLQHASDDEGIRIVIDEARRARQNIALLRDRSDIHRHVVRDDLKELRASFDGLVEDRQDILEQIDEFAELADKLDAVLSDDEVHHDEIRRRWQRLRQLFSEVALEDEVVLRQHFEYFVIQIHKAKNPEKFASMIEIGRALIDEDRVPELRGLLGQMADEIPSGSGLEIADSGLRSKHK